MPAAGPSARRGARRIGRRSRARSSSNQLHQLVEHLVADVDGLGRGLERALVAQQVRELLVQVDAGERLALVLELLLERLGRLRAVARLGGALAHLPGEPGQEAAERRGAERALPRGPQVGEGQRILVVAGFRRQRGADPPTRVGPREEDRDRLRVGATEQWHGGGGAAVEIDGAGAAVRLHAVHLGDDRVGEAVELAGGADEIAVADPCKRRELAMGEGPRHRDEVPRRVRQAGLVERLPVEADDLLPDRELVDDPAAVPEGLRASAWTASKKPCTLSPSDGWSSSFSAPASALS